MIKYMRCYLEDGNINMRKGGSGLQLESGELYKEVVLVHVEQTSKEAND